MKFSDKTGDELSTIIRTGADAAQFLSYPFYAEKLRPQLEREMRAAKNNGDWKPGMSTELATIAMVNAYNSGLQEGLTGIDVTIGQLIKNGLEAEKEINYRKDKAKKETSGGV